MSAPDLTRLETAYSLCVCGDVCTRACTVCFSVTYQYQACVKQLWYQANMSVDNIARVAVPPSKEQLIEDCIDWLENNGMPLLPWQAAAFRAIMTYAMRR